MNTPYSKETRVIRLIEQYADLLKTRRLIVASNRGPVEYNTSPDGVLQARRGNGGVVTALSNLTRFLDFSWVTSAMGEGDRRITEQSNDGRVKSSIPGHKLFLRYVVTPRRMYHKFYNIFCNPLLWFLQHYMWSTPYTPNIDDAVYDAWYRGYVPVNKLFADTIIEESKHSELPPYVMLHDYHLYLTPATIRHELPQAIIQYLIHIPWPDPSYWQMIPLFMRQSICESLCTCDIVAFQTPRDARSFLESCELFLENVSVDYSLSAITTENHTTLVKVYPLSIDVEEMRHMANSQRSLDHEIALKSLLGERTIVRVDRVEPSKNIVRGFKAFRLMLQRYPELIGKIKFLAFLVPSRTHIKQYQRYLEEVDSLISEINQTFGTSGWEPISVFYENNYTQAIAAMKLYDVLIVNPTIDGMNLVAKEGPIVNTKNGLLILSETTGAHHQLKNGVISVSPTDVEGTSQALYQAITATMTEREKQTAELIDKIEKEDIITWLQWQINDIKDVISRVG